MFKVGDTIRIRIHEGRVVKMGIRTTIIEDKDGNVISIPNLLFSTNPVIRKKNGVHSKGIH